MDQSTTTGSSIQNEASFQNESSLKNSKKNTNREIRLQKKKEKKIHRKRYPVVPVPSKRLLLILFIPLPGLSLGIVIPPLFKPMLLLDLAIIGLALFDMIRLYYQGRITVEAHKEEKLSIGRITPIGIKIKRAGTIPLITKYQFDLPQFLSQGKNKAVVILEPECDKEFLCNLMSVRRGEYFIKTINLRVRSRLSLVSLYCRYPINLKLLVTPDLENLKEFVLLSRKNRLLSLGIHKQKNRGQGYELDFLRDYIYNDDARLIDWKASMRVNKPLVKEFHLENTSEMVVVLDCGRFMISEENNMTALDLAINAILVLAQLAVSMGDRIRIIPFSDKIMGDFSSSRGKSPLKNLIHFLTPLKAEMVASDYAGIFRYLNEKVHKRSLLIFMSDIVGNVNGTLWKNNFSLLSKRHTTLFMLLKDKLVQAEIEREAETEEDIFAIVAARSLYMERNKMLWELKRSGVHILDILPGEITVELVNKYLAFKSGMMGRANK